MKRIIPAVVVVFPILFLVPFDPYTLFAYLGWVHTPMLRLGAG